METQNSLLRPTQDATQSNSLPAEKTRSLFGWIFNITNENTPPPEESWYGSMANIYNVSASTLTRACSSVASYAGSFFGGPSLNPQSFKAQIDEGDSPDIQEVQSMLETMLKKGYLAQFSENMNFIFERKPDDYKSLFPPLFPQLLFAGLKFPADDHYVNDVAMRLLPEIDSGLALNAACTFQYPNLSLEILDRDSSSVTKYQEAITTIFDTLIAEKLKPEMEPVIRSLGQMFVHEDLVERGEENLIYAFIVGAEKLLEIQDDRKKRAAKQLLQKCVDQNRVQDLPTRQTLYQPARSDWFPSALQTTLWLSRLSNSRDREQNKFDTVSLAIQTRGNSQSRQDATVCLNSIEEALSQDNPTSSHFNGLLRHFLEFFTPSVSDEPRWDLIDEMFRLFKTHNKKQFRPFYQEIFTALIVLPYHNLKQARPDPISIRRAEEMAISLIDKGLVSGRQRISFMGCHPLHLAVRLGYWKLTSRLLKNPKVDVTQTDNEGHTPFIYLDSHRREADFNPDPSHASRINELAEEMAKRHPDIKNYAAPMKLFEDLSQEEKTKRPTIHNVKEWHKGFKAGSLSSTQAIEYLPDLMRHEYWKMIPKTAKPQR